MVDEINFIQPSASPPPEPTPVQKDRTTEVGQKALGQTPAPSTEREILALSFEQMETQKQAEASYEDTRIEISQLHNKVGDALYLDESEAEEDLLKLFSLLDRLEGLQENVAPGSDLAKKIGDSRDRLVILGSALDSNFPGIAEKTYQKYQELSPQEPVAEPTVEATPPPKSEPPEDPLKTLIEELNEIRYSFADPSFERDELLNDLDQVEKKLQTLATEDPRVEVRTQLESIKLLRRIMQL